MKYSECTVVQVIHLVKVHRSRPGFQMGTSLVKTISHIKLFLSYYQRQESPSDFLDCVFQDGLRHKIHGK